MEIGIIGYLTYLTQRIRVLDPSDGLCGQPNRLRAKQTQFGEFGEFLDCRFRIADWHGHGKRVASSREPVAGAGRDTRKAPGLVTGYRLQTTDYWGWQLRDGDARSGGVFSGQGDANMD